MNLEMKGRVVKMLDKQSGMTKAGKQWMKQGIVIDNGAKYNSEVCFNFFGEDKLSLLDGLEQGDNVEVLFNLSSREYKGNYYTSADAWKIQKVGLTEDTNESNINEDLPF